MYKAKAFFFVCAGLFLVALSYHLGARTAGAQSGEQLVDIAWRRADGHAYAVSTTGAIYATPGYCQPWSLVGQMPAGCVPVCVLDGDVGGSLDIACADGSAWTLQGNVPSVSVIHCSEVFGGATAAQKDSWGAMKSRYRGERGAAQPAPQDR